MGEYRINTFRLIVDFKAVYGSTDRTQIFKAMEKFQIPRKIRKVEKITLRNIRRKVKTLSGTTNSFDTKKGLRQGDALSCVLFNIALEKVVRKTNLDITGTIQHTSLQILAYADVVVIVGRHENAVKDVFYRLETEAQKMPLKIMTKQNVRKQKKEQQRNKKKYIRIINRDIWRK